MWPSLIELEHTGSDMLIGVNPTAGGAEGELGGLLPIFALNKGVDLDRARVCVDLGNREAVLR